MADAFVHQFGKTDTLASQMAAGASTATLSSGNFTSFTNDYLVLDYNNASKREVIKCTVAGTAISAATRAIQGSDVTHSAGASVGYNWIPNHADYYKNAIVGGWVDASIIETWVYASASTFTVAGVDVTGKYHKGTKLRFKQGGGYKYAVVASSSFSTNTTVTIAVNTDYTIANAAITDNAYSYDENPQAFPGWFAYTPTYGGFSAAPTQSVRYKISGRSITMVAAVTNAAGTSNATTFTISSPVAAVTDIRTPIWCVDNTSTTTVGRLDTAAASATMSAFTSIAGAAWTGSGTKGISFHVTFDF